MQDVIDADTQIEEMSWRNPRWVRHIVRGALRGNPEARCTEVRSRAVGAHEGDVASGSLATAEESDRRLLIASECERILKAPDRAGDETGIIPPGQRGPGSRPLLEDVLDIGRRVELLIMVDTKVAAWLL